MTIVHTTKGYTLIELIIVMLIFIIVIMLAGTTFDNIYRISRQQEKLAESNIEGKVGLEMLRADVSHAGFGLPWVFNNLSTMPYAEAAIGSNGFAQGVDPDDYNDAPRAPRPVVVGSAARLINGAAGTGPDYLVIKSSKASTSAAAKKWTYFVYSSASGANKSYLKVKNLGNDYSLNDRVIAVSNAFTSHGALTRNLLLSGSSFSFRVDFYDPADAFKPADASQQVVTYGLFNSQSQAPRMPFNRVDYFVQRPAATAQMPASCNSGTGILYKGVISQQSGSFDPVLPLLNCVGDMKVLYQLDMDDNGAAGTFVNPAVEAGNSRSGSETTTDTDVADTLSRPELLRKRLKEVRVYILAHEGQKDRGFTYPVTTASEAVIVGEGAVKSLSRIWSESAMTAAFGADWKQYRWNLYRVVVRPGSLY